MFNGVFVLGRQRSPGIALVIFGILLIVLSGLFALTIASRNSQVSAWEDESPLDTSWGANLRRAYVASSKSKGIRYSPAVTLGLGLLLIVVGVIVKLA